MSKIVALLFISVALSGCVSNKTVATIEASDYSLSCEKLQEELATHSRKLKNAKDDSGFTFGNAVLAWAYWPLIIVSEVQAHKNQESIRSRVEHLSTMNNDECLMGPEGIEILEQPLVPE